MSAAKKLMMAGDSIDWASISHGDFVEGGFFAGVISILGSNYAILVAPKSSEQKQRFKPDEGSTVVASSLNDGLQNSMNMNSSLYPAAQYCMSYAGGGFSDWYLPARDELELLYRNLKPATYSNYTNSRAYPASGLNGENASSVPAGAMYTTSSPAQTTAAVFKAGGAEALDSTYSANDLNAYWSSTVIVASTSEAYRQNMDTGKQSASSSVASLFVRPIRRVKI